MAAPTAIDGQEVRFNIRETTGTGLVGVTTLNDVGGLDPSGESVVLGSATFSIGAAAVGSHQVTLVANEDIFGDRFSTANGLGIPDILAISDPTTFTFVVTAVPEPSSLAALGLLGGVLMCRRRRRGKNARWQRTSVK